MHLRDKMFLLSGFLLVLVGSVLSILWNLLAGLISLLLLAYLCLILLVLQRRQLARVQKRTLDLVKWTTKRGTRAAPSVKDGSKQCAEIPTKRIIGILQAQQMSMERLSRKIDSLPNRNDNNPRVLKNEED